MPAPATVELRDAARELGVHYQTAYRWVRSGQLPASMVAGRYAVARSDLEEFVRRREQATPVPRPTPRRLEGQAERMYEALHSGDDSGARQIARRLVEEGTPVTDLIGEVLSPPLRRIGESWHAGEIPIYVEHRAAAIVGRILGELTPTPRGRRRGTVMVAAVAGDRHALPTAMAAAALREDNWRVEHLGADLPAQDIVDFCRSHDITVAVLTVTNSQAADLSESVAEELRSLGTPVVVGGRGRTLEDLLTRVRAASTGADAASS